MKSINTKNFLSALALGIGLQAFSQQTLPEVTVSAIKYKYLYAVSKEEVSQPVKMLQRRAAEYNIKTADFYEENYDTYFVSFFIPEGQLLASYDKNGKLLTTAEKYKDVDLPKNIKAALTERFPNWSISHDIYLVSYHEDENNVRKEYKLTLRNGDKRLKVKINEKGEIV